MGFLWKWLDGIARLAGWEMVRLARRGQAYRARMMVLYLVFLAFVLMPFFYFRVYGIEFPFWEEGSPIPLGQKAAFGEWFSVLIVDALCATALLITPGYAAAALSEEKERKSLQLLLTTGLSDREIIWGKAVGRGLFVATAVFAALPVMLAAMMFGGISPMFLLGSFAVILSCIALGAGIGLRSAAVTPNMRRALISAYRMSLFVFCLIPPCVVLSPFAIIKYLHYRGDDRIPGIAGMYVLFALCITAVFLNLAAAKLRGDDPDGVPVAPKPVETTEEKQPTEQTEESDLDRLGGRIPVRIELPPIDVVNPLLWKERWGLLAGPGGDAEGKKALVRIVCLAPFVLGLIALIVRTSQGDKTAAAGHMLMIGSVLLAAAYLVPFGSAVSAAIARERQQDTLDGLLCLPLARAEILETKLWAAAERSWWFMPLAAFGLFAVFLPLAGLSTSLLIAGCLVGGWCFVAGLGLFLSVRQSTELKAFRFLLPAIVIVIGAPVRLWNDTAQLKSFPEQMTFAGIGLALPLMGLYLSRRANRGLESIDPRRDP